MLVSDRDKALQIVKAFSDEYSRRIVLCVISRSLPIEEISAEEHIPISTCYRRVRELQGSGILRADRTVIQEDGKKYVCYKTSFKNAKINLDSGQLTVDVMPNRDPSEKLHDIWANLRSMDDVVELERSIEEAETEVEEVKQRQTSSEQTVVEA